MKYTQLQNQKFNWNIDKISYSVCVDSIKTCIQRHLDYARITAGLKTFDDK